MTPGFDSFPAGPNGLAGRVESTTLESGLRVVTDEMPGSASITALALVGLGGRDEPAELAGASHFLEHLLCKGSASTTAEAVAEAVDATGGDLDAFTDREHTAVQIRVPAEAAKFALDLLGSSVSSPALREREVEVERRIILEELAQALDDPEDRAGTLAAAAVFGQHPLGREVIGDPETLERLDRDAIAEFHAREYRPDSMVISVAGALSHAAVVEAVKGWELPDGGGGLTEERTVPTPQPASREHLSRDSEQVTMIVTWPLGPTAQSDRPALSVLAHLLGGGPASRLFRSVRDEEGLAYAVEAGMAFYSDVSCLSAFAACAAGSLELATTLILDEVAKLSNGEVNQRQVDVAKGYLVGSATLSLESAQTRSWWAAVGELERGGARDPQVWIDRYREVTIEDVLLVANRLSITPTIITVGPI